jgi:hypothetical protein
MDKDEALELTQIDFGGDCDTPPKPWPAIWVAWNSEDGFTFWKHQNQAVLWSAADSNEWPVQYAMQKAQPAPVQPVAFEQWFSDYLGPLTTKFEKSAMKAAWNAALENTPPAAQRQWVGLTDDQIEAIWYDHHDREMGYAMRFARAIEAAHGITKGQP